MQGLTSTSTYTDPATGRVYAGDAGIMADIVNSGIAETPQEKLYKTGGDVGTRILLNAPKYDWKTDPGYEFVQSEAMRGVMSNASALGGVRSGGTLKALQDRSSSIADQQYGTIFNRLAGIAQGGQQVPLGQYAAIGASAIGQGGSNAIGAANSIGAAGAYGAQGAASSAAAWGGAFSDVVGAVPWGKLGGGGNATSAGGGSQTGTGGVTNAPW